MRQEWIEQLSETYFEDIDKEFDYELISGNFVRNLGKAFRTGRLEQEGKGYIYRFFNEITNIDPIVKDAADYFGFSGWDLLAMDQKKQFYNAIYQEVGIEGVKLLKETLKLPVDEIISISGWEEMSDFQRLEFINMMMDAFGTKETLDAAKKCGLDVKKEVEAGLASDNGAIKGQANRIVQTINSELKKVSNVKIDADADLQVKIDALVNIVPDIQGGVLQAAKTAISTVSAKVNKNGLLKASGQYGIDRGSVFIANEKSAELIGTINGKTSVANQQEIIDGIARGVENANQDQNTLLREQNTLLRQILQKDNSVRLSASAQLGRVTRQSLEMYGSMTGG